MAVKTLEELKSGYTINERLLIEVGWKAATELAVKNFTASNKQRDVTAPSHHCECGAKECVTICTECGGYLE